MSPRPIKGRRAGLRRHQRAFVPWPSLFLLGPLLAACPNERPASGRDLGAACTENQGCDSGRCLADLPGGYCSTPCPGGEVDCPSGGSCRAGVCLDRCDSAEACRAGYACHDQTCQVPCTRDEECRSTEICDVSVGCVPERSIVGQ